MIIKYNFHRNSLLFHEWAKWKEKIAICTLFGDFIKTINMTGTEKQDNNVFHVFNSKSPASSHANI